MISGPSSSQAKPDAPPEAVIQPQGSGLWAEFSELWRYRELFWTLMARSILVRYKQTLVGVLWALIRPLFTMIIFTLLFGQLAKFGEDPAAGEVPYFLLVFAGVLPWQLFSTSLTGSAGSVVANAGMVSKIYFPRTILPASACLTTLLDFLIAFALFIILMLGFGFMPSWRLVFLPGFLGIALLAAMGAGFWLSALNVHYRDIRHILPFMIQMMIYISPVGYLSSKVYGSTLPGYLKTLFILNPMVAVIDGFRWSLLGVPGALDPIAFAVSAGMVLLIFISGYLFFRKMMDTFADVI
ncbi:MAG: ABC transporter permease [Planctomycetes bacterium]|nr:ABC transporter permease [Planctomycetota bacterium]